ncbi:hypothetical protein [Methanosaeta sp. UBA356]|jgi:hypothetical protein|uniref:hypothetical protein n=1 Tax=Methanosaeta sp. UBA356 TaxID=1915559 RepID=UPI00257F4843|nr:hypothetical protein [Methanosaeta sp. UBA356]
MHRIIKKSIEEGIMGLNYESLDERTREFMLREIEFDIAKGNLYLSKRFNENGLDKYLELLKSAAQKQDDNWLGNELRRLGCFKAFIEKKTPSGGSTKIKVPVNAAETFAEGEFNRFYIRGLCRVAIEDGILELEICRGKEVSRPRIESEARIGKTVPAEKLLEDLRKYPGVEPALGVPSGPNSGLTARLPS